MPVSKQQTFWSKLTTSTRRGDPFIWLSGGSLAIALLMIGALLSVVVLNGFSFFWPHEIATIRKTDGTMRLGAISDKQDELRGASGAVVRGAETQIKTGNRDLYGADFIWIADADIESIDFNGDVIALERQEYGDFYGFLLGIESGGQSIAEGESTWAVLNDRQPVARETATRARKIQRHDIGAINKKILATERQLARGPADERALEIEADLEKLQAHYQELSDQAQVLLAEARREVAIVRSIDGRETTVALADIVRAYRPNQMGVTAKVRHYFSRLAEFVGGEPRESNTEGGVFPAIFGTVSMTIIMSLMVTPFGVVAAFYLREYADQGFVVRIVRVAINNLAGVPSIVFGVFGLGFFVYFIGGGIDQWFFSDSLPNPTFGTGGILWASLTLALLTVPVVIVATEESIAAVPRGAREGSLALGASKFQTICKVVLPASIPGILTGIILAMARGAGEVAPLMITGVVKLAPELPIDADFPFVHLDRKFMHLGFHIYDVGFQSPNIEAALPMVYTTTLLLIAIVVLLNIAAIRLRDRIRRRYKTGAFA